MEYELERTIELQQFGSERLEVIYRKARPLSDAEGGYPGFTPGGTTVENGIRAEYDVAVTLRDGTVIYTDIFRPEGQKDIPAIICWGPYGKRRGWWTDTFFPTSGAVPKGAISPMARFEGLDPAYWCHHGYAIINPDTRGIGMSQGDLPRFSWAEGRDCADLIEWIAVLDWCNGKVSMAGDSWLGIAQYFAAAEQPPHLACIAPWQGHFVDYYRGCMALGGIPTHFDEFFSQHFWGVGRVEDIPAMIDKYPLINGYWEEKIADLSKINVPAYIAGIGSGPTASFRGIASPDKWYRHHFTNEWTDLYSPESIEDLRRFYDRYLKGIRNGWEYTPRVRLTIQDPGRKGFITRNENEWPLARTQFQPLYLNAEDGTMSLSATEKESLIRYCADDGKGQVTFTYRFTSDAELSGFMKLHLWVEAEGSNDMDVFVVVDKLDEQGNVLPCVEMGSVATGQLRASHRDIDEKKSFSAEPYHTHRREVLLKAREIIPIDIPLSSNCVLYHAGQQLRVTVRGFRQSVSLMPGMPPEEPPLRNKGNHVVLTGGRYDSHLIVPAIPDQKQ